MGIVLSERNSILFFYGIILFSAFCASFGAYSKKYLNRYIGKVFVFLGFLVLLVPLGLRKVGIDHEVYVEWFEKADYWLVRNYHFTPEPLFAVITLFSKNTLNSFQFIYFFAAFVFLIGIYVFLLRTNSFGFVSIFFYNVAIYLYMCGLTRISIALGIVAVGYTHINNTKKYLFFVFLAMLFHYSSVVSLLVLFSHKSKKRFAFKNLIYIIIGVYALSYIITRFSGELPYVIARYASYIRFAFQLRNITSCAILVPAIILWFVFSKDYASLYDSKFRTYDNIMKTLIILIFISMSFEGTFRLTFYFYPFIAKVYYDFSKVLQKNNGVFLRFVYPAVFTVAGVIYVYEVFFKSPYITPLIIPFSM